MPTLPSGKRLWLSMESILPPGRMFYPCRPGYFWYRDIDPAGGWLPLPGAESPPECWRQARIPANRLEAARYVRILCGRDGSHARCWHGDWLISYRRPEGFSKEDWDTCLDFFGSDRTLTFLEMVIERCRQQSNNRGTLDLDGFEPSLGGEAVSAVRLARAASVVDRLDMLLDTALMMEDEESAADIRERISEVRAFAEMTLDSYGPHRGLAHRVAAATALSAGEVEDVVRHGRAATRLLPDDRDFGRTLAIRLRRKGHPDAARALSREMLHGRMSEDVEN
jgi:hypothetical protein